MVIRLVGCCRGSGRRSRGKARVKKVRRKVVSSKTFGVIVVLIHIITSQLQQMTHQPSTITLQIPTSLKPHQANSTTPTRSPTSKSSSTRSPIKARRTAARPLFTRVYGLSQEKMLKIPTVIFSVTSLKFLRIN